jgi:hypothetical protein
VSRTDGCGGGGELLDGGGPDDGWDVDGCGAGEDLGGPLVRGRPVDGDGAGDLDECRDLGAPLDPEAVVDGDTDADPCDPPNGALDNCTGLLPEGARPTGCPPPPCRSNTTAAPAPSRQTISTSTATRATDTAGAGPTSPAARNAPQSGQTNSSSVSRPHLGHPVIAAYPGTSDRHVSRFLQPAAV